MKHSTILNHQNVTSTLIHGVDIISQRLRYCLSPMSRLYQFNLNPPYNPKPLTLFVVLSILSSLLGLILLDYLLFKSSTEDNLSSVFKLATDSVFFVRLFRFYEVIRITTYFAIILTILYHHGNIANVMAQNNIIVTKKEQAHIAKISFAIFFFKVICSCITFASITYYANMASVSMTIIATILTFFISLCSQAPLIYVCYFGTVLGKHIENFSELHIDTLFDQCVKSKDGNEDLSRNGSPVLDNINSKSNLDLHDKFTTRKGSYLSNCCFGCIGCLYGCFGFLKRTIVYFWRSIKNLYKFLMNRKYPELPEMKMTKLSSKIEISDTMRVTNTHLIRIRLRRTQIMLSELRDTVSDINKLSSPIILLKLIQETLLLVLISTGSIQVKAYRTISIAMVPTIVQTIGLICGIVYICNCLDYTTSQLKLMINKLFDFIIMNHRVDNNDNMLNGVQLNPLMSMNQLNRALQSSTSMSYLSDKEDETLSETWSQFQYTRKLANTIQFTIGGILTASRRLVLPILGHILSAVFISIEIMSIIDTSKDSKAHSRGTVLDNINN